MRFCWERAAGEVARSITLFLRGLSDLTCCRLPERVDLREGRPVAALESS